MKWIWISLGAFLTIIIVAAVAYVATSKPSVEEMMVDKMMEEGMVDEAMLEEKDIDEIVQDEIEPEMEEEVMEEKEDAPEEMMEDEAMEESAMEEDSEEVTFTGRVLAGSSSPFIEYNSADWEKAMASDKLVVVYFYANWCPICKFELSTGTHPAFNDLDRDDVVGFRVNYNDNATDDEERQIARDHGVAYQHTKVFLKNGTRVLKSPESWGKDRYIEEINAFAN